MGKISEQTERDPVDGTEYIAAIQGGSNYKVLLSTVKDYILGLASSLLSQIDYSDEGTKSTGFTISLSNNAVKTYTLNTATSYDIILTTSSVRKSVVVVELIATANVTIDIYNNYMGTRQTSKWADGVELTSLSNGEIARLHITMQGLMDVSINWVKMEAV